MIKKSKKTSKTAYRLRSVAFYKGGNKEDKKIEIRKGGGGCATFWNQNQSQQRNSSKKRVTGQRFCMAVAL